MSQTSPLAIGPITQSRPQEFIRGQRNEPTECEAANILFLARESIARRTGSSKDDLSSTVLYEPDELERMFRQQFDEAETVELSPQQVAALKAHVRAHKTTWQAPVQNDETNVKDVFGIDTVSAAVMKSVRTADRFLNRFVFGD